MTTVALFIYGIGDLSGGGGAERFFADFYDLYQNDKNKSFKLNYIIDEGSLKNLQRVGKLKTNQGVLKFKLVSNRFKTKLECWQLLKYIVLNRIRLIHLPLYNPTYIPLLQFINNLPSLIRPKIVINISNCFVVPYLSDKTHKHYATTADTYLPLFNTVNVAGYFSWYSNFKTFIEASNFKQKPEQVYAITSRFSDTSKFFPQEKSNIVVFASRLDEQKHPDWFVEAISKLNETHSELVASWKFVICGKGPLRESLQSTVDKRNLSNIIQFRLEGELQKVVNHSKIYVSCQDFENFPSLSMAESMAAGNAIIARNVGQTELFVKNNVNGLLLTNDSVDGLCEALLKLLQNIDLVDSMGLKSTEMTKTTHTYSNFVSQIENFWKSIIK